MKKISYIFLISAFCLSSFVFIFGCGKYATQYSAPVIIDRYPAADAGGIGSAEPTIYIKFSKSMDTSGITSIEGLTGKIISASDMTATTTFYPTATPEVIWSDDDTKLTITNVFFIANPGNRIHLQASKEAFQDVNGLYLTEKADLWNFTLAGLNIASRFPPINATVTNLNITHEVTFNNAVATWEYFIGPSHTAGMPDPPSPTMYISDSNMTVTFEVTSWEAGSPSVADITYEAIDIYGNIVTNGQLFKYNVQ